MRVPASRRVAGRLSAALRKTLTTPPLLPASALLLQPETLLPAIVVGLSNPLVHLNARTLGFPAFARWLHAAYVARDEALPAVQLGRYAPGALLDGEGTFLVLTAGALLADQLPQACGDLSKVIASMQARASRAVAVDRPCLLACRFGEWTWGHWMLDVLPKIVLAERFAPQRFTYAVPAGIVDPSFGRYAEAVLESLAAYGIEPSRLLRVRPGSVYRFDTLFDIAGVSGKSMHPGVLDAMRRLRIAPAGRNDLTAAFRTPPSIRCLSNSGGIRDMLARAGAAFLDVSSASFREQAAAFRNSEIIVGDLGSNLAVSIYAMPGTGLVTLAPAGWHDDYFPKLFQRLGLVLADIRGHALPARDQPFHHASVAINPAELEAGLHAVQVARLDGGWHIRSNVDGRVTARAPGAAILEIAFGAGGNADLFRLQNFYPAEALRRWSFGANSQLVIPCPLQGQSLWLEIVGNGFVSPPHLVSRPFAVSVNRVLLADLDIDETVRVHVLIPATLVSGGELVVDFHHPACPSPQAMGVSADARALGVMFERVALRLLTPRDAFGSQQGCERLEFRDGQGLRAAVRRDAGAPEQLLAP